jgi:hypothetical protein
MRVASGIKKAAGRAGGRSLAAPMVVLCAGLLLASCAGTSNEDGFSAYVADHWPHWAGGMPSDVPPRPGSPGYNQFIAHGQADQDVLPPANGANAPAVPVTPVFQTAPAASGPARPQAPAMSAEPVAAPQPAPGAQPMPQQPPSAPPAPESASEDANVVRGGLY